MGFMANKDVLMKFFDVENRRDWECCRRFLAPGVVWYPHSVQPLSVSGIDGLIVGDFEFYLG